MSTSFTHTDRDGDQIRIHHGAHGAVFNAIEAATESEVAVAVRYEDLAAVIAVLQSIRSEGAL